MFDLRRLVHTGVFARQPAAETINIVAITQSRDDAEALGRIAAEYHWKISIVDSVGAAVALLHEQPTPIIICDRDLPNEAWPDVLAKVASQPVAVCVLLASRVVDDYLWRQVIEHRGYDLVAKPFQPENLRRAVTFAWSWRGWAARHS